MLQEINDVIKSSLPEHVGKVLRERLDQADKDKEALDRAIGQVSSLTQRVEKLSKLQSDEQKLAALADALKTREEAINTRELESQKRDLEVQLQAERIKSQFAQDLAMGLVRNTEYRRTIMDTKTKPVVDSYGTTHYPNSTRHLEETETQA